MGVVLITGGAGSLGAEVALLLNGRGRGVRVLDLPSLDYSRLKAAPGIEVCGGDITDRAFLDGTAHNVDCVIHLAALLPPAAEKDWSKTEAVNVEGTMNLLEAVRAQNSGAHFIFSSSVAAYGDTTMEEEPLRPERELKPNDFYSRSKALAEGLVVGSGLPYTVLRISGIVIPAILEPPPVWPFMREQRMEFVCRGDVVAALLNCVGNRGAQDRIFNIAGGTTWQMRGHQYVEALFNIMGVPPEESGYLERPGWFHWYQTADSHATLNYQHTTFQTFLERVEQAMRELMG